MSQNFPFTPNSPTFAVTTSGTTLTPLSQQVSFASPASSQPAAQATGLTQTPPNVRIVNTSTGIVYVSITNVPRTAAVPGANPSQEFPVNPGEDRVFGVPASPLPVNLNTLYINTIAVGTSATLMVTFGEGV
jgi:hypothetical protein